MPEQITHWIVQDFENVDLLVSYPDERSALLHALNYGGDDMAEAVMIESVEALRDRFDNLAINTGLLVMVSPAMHFEIYQDFREEVVAADAA